MKRYLLIIIVLMSVQEMSAQRHNPTYIWYYAGGRFGAEVSSMNPEWMQGSNHSFMPTISYLGGGMFGYCYSYYDEFRIGLEYSNKSFAVDYNYPNVLPDDYKFIPDMVEWQAGYLGFSLFYNRNILHGMLGKWYLSVGIVPEFRTGVKEYTTFMNKYREHTYNFQVSGDFNKVALSGIVSTGFRIRFAQQFAIDIEPWYRIYLRPIHPDLFGKNPTAYGGTIGFCFEW